MKPQDSIFLILLGILLYKRKPRIFVFAGMLCLLLAIPLFATWTFFTAERLTWYASAFFFIACVLFFFPSKKDK